MACRRDHATLQMIATEIGVTPPTVSRVLNSTSDFGPARGVGRHDPSRV